jgi:hypothetical protein
MPAMLACAADGDAACAAAGAAVSCPVAPRGIDIQP